MGIAADRKSGLFTFDMLINVKKLNAWIIKSVLLCSSALQSVPVNKGDAIFVQLNAAPVFVKKPPPRCFVMITSVSCLFLPLTTNVLAQAVCKNGNYFAWQGISLELNNGSSCEILQQGLTFGSSCLLPRLIYVSRLCSVPHQEEVLQETKI